MPHIHTEPGQHDITVSAWIVRTDGPVPRVLVHMHRKMGKLMQVGGHVEIDETPWQTLAHELSEESGFAASELRVLQSFADVPVVEDAVVHPVPLLSNTHKVTETHYHSDYCYGFVADAAPNRLPEAGESQDLRWLTLDELRQTVAEGITFQDVYDIYRHVVEKCLPNYHQIDSGVFSTKKPIVLK